MFLRFLTLLVFVVALSVAQIGSPFVVLSAVAPVAGVTGAELAYDTTNKLLWIQVLPASGGAAINAVAVSPHVLDSGGAMTQSLTFGGTTLTITLSTGTVAGSDQLFYRISNGNVAQDKFCSTVSPLPAGAVVCAVIPF